jgi:hypothetical protein
MTSRFTLYSYAALAATFVLASPGRTHDWPQWRGPDRDNVSKESGWSSTGAADALWRADVGWGYSSPVVAAGRLYVTGYFASEETPHQGEDRVSCLDAETGAVIWTDGYPADAYDNEHGGGALSTPTVHEGTLFVPTRAGGVRAYAAADGALHWTVDLVERHAVDPGRYGFSSSPYVLGANIVLNASRTVALDRASGETAWVSESYDANFSTVAEITVSGRACLAVFGGEGLVLIDAATGEHVTTYVFRETPRNVEGATPIVMGERVLISSGYEQGIALVDFSGGEPDVVWRNRTLRTKMDGGTLWGEHLYGFDGSMLKCIDLEGNELWRKRGLGFGALTVADGRLLVTTSDGELLVATATPEEYREEHRRPVVADGGMFWTGPVLANGCIYLRGSHGNLACLDHRGGQVAGVAAAGEADGELPAPAELRRRHLAASGLAAHPVTGIRMIGEFDIDSLGLIDCEGLWESAAGGLWHTRIYNDAFKMTIERYFDGELGWEAHPRRGNSLIEGGALDELRATGGHRSLFDPLAGGTAETVAREVFHGVPCYRVDIALAPERSRQVYFAVDSGLLVGRAGTNEATAVFADWREVDDRRLPYVRREFDAETAEESRWQFSEITFVEPDVGIFEIPEELLEPSEGN